MNSMTQGRPLPLILRFTLPLLLGNLFQQAYNMADAAIVSRYLGTSALAAVGASSSVQFLVIGFCTGACCGFAIPIAQTFGAEDHRTMRRLIFHGMALTLGIAVLLTAACALLCPQILHLLSTSAEIFDDAYAYLLIIFLGIPFTLLYNLLSAILRAVGDSRTPFLFLALSAFLNIVLDLLAVVVFDMGVAGAALATIASQAVSGVLCWRYIARHVPVLWFGRESMKFDGTMDEADAQNGPPDGAAVVHHRHRQHGHAVGEQQSGQRLHLRLHRRHAHQAAGDVPLRRARDGGLDLLRPEPRRAPPRPHPAGHPAGRRRRRDLRRASRDCC